MRWLILAHRIPPNPRYLRAKIRQRLASVGAVAVKNSVYVLPHSSDALEDLQWIAQEITAGGGDAHLFEGDFVDPAAGDAAVEHFRSARAGDYEALAAEARSAMNAARGAAAVDELTAAYGRLSRRLEDIQRIDFFETPARAAAEEAVAELERKVQRDRQEETRVLDTHPELRGRTWVTRPGVKIDRMASAWFIRRFIDPRARFRFEDPSAERREGDVRFDMVGGDFTHEEDRCTLETLVRRVGLPDRGVRAIAEIVHDIDLKDSKFDRAEAAGLRMMIEGIIARHEGDAERIERASAVFDDLHEALARGKRTRKPAEKP